MPQSTIQTLKGLVSIQRQAQFVTGKDGVPRMAVSAEIAGTKSAVITVETSATTTGPLYAVGYAPSPAIDTSKYQRFSLVAAIGSGTQNAGTCDYYLEWSADGIYWYEDWVTIAGAVSGVNLPITNYIPLIHYTASSDPEGTPIQQSGYYGDVKALWMRIRGRHSDDNNIKFHVTLS